MASCSTIIERPRLDARFQAASGGLLRLLAPGGYGKSTLISRWASHDARTIRWLDLEPTDNDPMVLAHTLTQALSGLGSSRALSTCSPPTSRSTWRRPRSRSPRWESSRTSTRWRSSPTSSRGGRRAFAWQGLVVASRTPTAFAASATQELGEIDYITDYIAQEWFGLLEPDRPDSSSWRPAASDASPRTCAIPSFGMAGATAASAPALPRRAHVHRARLARRLVSASPAPPTLALLRGSAARIETGGVRSTNPRRSGGKAKATSISPSTTRWPSRTSISASD